MIRFQLMVGPKSGAGGLFGWLLRAGRRCLLDVELHMEHTNPSRPKLLHVTAKLWPAAGSLAAPPDWRERCGRIHRALRSYLLT
jgi:hypothetical protein